MLYLAGYILPYAGFLGTSAKKLEDYFTNTPTPRRSALGYSTQTTSSQTETTNNTCLKPRVRKEWRALTYLEKQSWMEAVKCLNGLRTSGTIDSGPYIPLQDVPYSTNTSLYDDFAFVHNILNNYVHQTGRLYVWHFEQTLIHQCHYTGSAPYWNWTLDSDDLGHSYLLDNSDPNIGFGNFGDEAHRQEVIDGALANFSLSYPYPHILRREYFPYPWKNLTPPWFTDLTLKVKDVITINGISETVKGFRGDFRGFQTRFERMQGPHMGVHLALGGDLGGICIWGTPFCDSLSYGNPGTSPNEPLFWLHHGVIDKIWHDWQNMHAENKYAFGGGSRREIGTWPKYPVGAPPDLTPDFFLPSVGFLPGGLTIKDMLDTTNDILCYTYE